MFDFKITVYCGLWEKAPGCDPLTTWFKQSIAMMFKQTNKQPNKQTKKQKNKTKTKQNKKTKTIKQKTKTKQNKKNKKKKTKKKLTSITQCYVQWRSQGLPGWATFPPGGPK